MINRSERLKTVLTVLIAGIFVVFGGSLFAQEPNDAQINLRDYEEKTIPELVAWRAPKNDDHVKMTLYYEELVGRLHCFTGGDGDTIYLYSDLPDLATPEGQSVTPGSLVTVYFTSSRSSDLGDGVLDQVVLANAATAVVTGSAQTSAPRNETADNNAESAESGAPSGPRDVVITLHWEDGGSVRAEVVNAGPEAVSDSRNGRQDASPVTEPPRSPPPPPPSPDTADKRPNTSTALPKMAGKSPRTGYMYQIQVGAFTQRSEADRFMKILQNNNVPVQAQMATVKNRTWTRLIIPNVSGNKVDSLRQQLGALGFTEIWVKDAPAN
jgi:cell division septation protein DedD